MFLAWLYHLSSIKLIAVPNNSFFLRLDLSVISGRVSYLFVFVGTWLGCCKESLSMGLKRRIFFCKGHYTVLPPLRFRFFMHSGHIWLKRVNSGYWVCWLSRSWIDLGERQHGDKGNLSLCQDFRFGLGLDHSVEECFYAAGYILQSSQNRAARTQQEHREIGVRS